MADERSNTDQPEPDDSSLRRDDPRPADDPTDDPTADSSSVEGSTPSTGSPNPAHAAEATEVPGPASSNRTAAASQTTSRPSAGGKHRRGSQDFSRTVLFTILGAIIPGVGLLAAKRRVAGGIVLAVFVLGLAALGIWALTDRDSLYNFVTSPANLKRIAYSLVAIALLWVIVVVCSHLALRGRRLAPAQRVGGSILVALLSFVVAAPMAVAARYTYTSADVVNSVFKSDTTTHSATRPKHTIRPNSGDPWAQTPRVNILLLGGDSGPDRTGLRTDSVILASIDTHTGDTTLFSIPRNTARMPFPTSSPLHKYYPNGFTNGDGENAQYFINAMYGQLPTEVPKDVIGKTDDLGADALKISVGDALGIPVDYYVMINLAGFKGLINALGGITVNVNSYIPIGGDHEDGRLPVGYLTPGPHQHLDGEHALWYARSRYDSDDFSRMNRQRCVINAMVEQANPANVLARYQQIAEAGKNLVATDIPQEELGPLVDLSLRVKKADDVRSVVFINGEDGFISAHPNFDRMRQRVKAALGEGSPSSSSSGSSPKKTSGSGKSSSSKSSSTAASEDVSNACAWQPSVAATAVKGGGG